MGRPMVMGPIKRILTKTTVAGPSGRKMMAAQLECGHHVVGEYGNIERQNTVHCFECGAVEKQKYAETERLKKIQQLEDTARLLRKRDQLLQELEDASPPSPQEKPQHPVSVASLAALEPTPRYATFVADVKRSLALSESHARELGQLREKLAALEHLAQEQRAQIARLEDVSARAMKAVAEYGTRIHQLEDMKTRPQSSTPPVIPGKSTPNGAAK